MQKILFLLTTCFIYVGALSQNVGIGTTAPNLNAALDISSANKGVLIPRMDSIKRQGMTHVTGMLVYDTTTQSFWYSNGASWVNITPKLGATGSMQYWNGKVWVTVPPGLPGQFLQYSTSGIPEWGGHPFAVTKTFQVDNITESTARSGDSTTFNKASPVDLHGIVWDSFPGPTIALNTKTIFADPYFNYSNMTNLIGGTNYFMRAYATSSAGTAYGNQLGFTTLPGILPVITTSAISNMQNVADTVNGTYTRVSCGGNVVNTGGQNITERGVCWSTTPNPTVALTTRSIDGTGVGAFTSQINLKCFTKYYLRSYATYPQGTVYGAEIGFNTTYLGQVYYGWSVFYIDTSGIHGLLAGQYDLAYPTGGVWGCSGTLIGTATAMGTGVANTTAIINSCSANGIAARICRNVENGLTNCSLPSKDELTLMKQRANYISLFYPTLYRYWSSSESSNTNVWTSFDNTDVKTTVNVIRAIKPF